SADELFEDGEAIGRLRPAGPPRPAARSMEYPFSFEVQPHKLADGDTPCDPATGRGAGTIVKLDEAAGTLVLRRSGGGDLPKPLPPPRPLNTLEQRHALERLAGAVLAGDGRYRALRDIVARARPRFRGAIERVHTTDLAQQRQRAATLDDSYLVI